MRGEGRTGEDASWTTDASETLTNLSEGTYRIRTRARTERGDVRQGRPSRFGRSRLVEKSFRQRRGSGGKVFRERGGRGCGERCVRRIDQSVNWMTSARMVTRGRVYSRRLRASVSVRTLVRANSRPSVSPCSASKDAQRLFSASP